MRLLCKGVLQSAVFWYTYYLVCYALSPTVDSPYSGGRLLRDMTSAVDQQAREYIDSLQNLRRSLHDNANVSAAVTVYRVFGKVNAIGTTIEISKHFI